MISSGGVNLVLDEAALQRIVSSRDGPVAAELARFGARIEGSAKRLLSGELVNVRTGRLRASTTWVLFESGGTLGVAVGSSTNYAEFLHDGTRYIEARRWLIVAAAEHGVNL